MRIGRLGVVGLVGLLPMIGLQACEELSGVAHTPEVFASGAALADAMAQSEETGKPVFALVTADWCGPCQRLKKDTISDERVSDWLAENTIPVYIDSDASPEDARRLGVSSIPASFVLRGEEVVAKQVGYAEPSEFLAFLQAGVSGG